MGGGVGGEVRARGVAGTRGKTSWSSRLTRAGQGAVVSGTLGPALAKPQSAWPDGAVDAARDRWWSGAWGKGAAPDRM